MDIIDVSSKSTNFGGGLELLMNDRKKDNSSGGGFKLNENDENDLDNLESELNELSNEHDFNINMGNKTDIFNPKIDSEQLPSVSFNELPIDSTQEKTSTWDGYSKFNDVPIYPDTPLQPKMSKEETLREKFKVLRKLESLEEKGVSLSKRYTMDSSLTEMQGEYETIMDEKAKANSIKFQGNMLMACINGIEFLNGRFDPFDIKLDGWSDQISENISDYDEVFGELHEKYKSKASMAPELKLLFQLGGSAMMVHMTNTMFKSSMPGMDDILRQNPDLMQQFQQAAMNSMSQSNPGFTGFMNNVVNSGSNQGGPPAPVATQGYGAAPPPQNRGGNNNYPSRVNESMGRSSIASQNEGISINSQFDSASSYVSKSARTNRPEMKGPADISDILSGLKTKTINIQPQQSQQPTTTGTITPNESSTISISDLKEIQNADGSFAKKSKRRQKSDKNILSLDI